MTTNVINKNNNEMYKVYDITYDKAGYPHFLIYKDGQWLRISAKYFRPLTSEYLANTLNSFDKLVMETF